MGYPGRCRFSIGHKAAMLRDIACMVQYVVNITCHSSDRNILTMSECKFNERSGKCKGIMDSFI